MSKERREFKVFLINNPSLATEWRALLGDKYLTALDFDLVFCNNLEESELIVWDGVVSIKFESLLGIVEEQLQKGKCLLLMGQVPNLFTEFPMVRLFKADGFLHQTLDGWTVLPEELLETLNSCYRKFKHV